MSLVTKLAQMNPWHFVWISVVFSEVFTLISNIIISLIWWNRISWELILIGSIDALLVSLAVSTIVIYFLKHTSRVERVNHELEREIQIRHAAEKELRESEERYRHILAAAPDSITITRLNDGRYIEVNDFFTKITGFTRKEVIGRTPFDLNLFVDPDDRQRLVDTLVQQGEVVGLEIQYRHKNGEIIDALLSARRLDLSGEDCLVAVTADITPRKRSEEALRESEEKYRLLVENQSDMVVKVDQQGRFLFVSPSYCKIFGKTEEELLGKTFMPLVHKEDQAATAKAMEKLYAPPYQAYIEQRAKTKEGWRWLAWADTAVLDDDGQVSAIIGVGRDITDRKLAEAETAALETRLAQAQKMEAIGTLAGGIAHDFNNILSAIIGYSEITLLAEYLSDNDKTNLQKILMAGERAKDLVQQILAFSRQTEIEPKPILLGGLIQETLKLLRATLPTTIEIVEDLQSDGVVVADPTQIHQVIMNLCTNAAHAMQVQGNQLTLRLTSADLGPDVALDHPSIIPGRFMRLSVADNGQGMDQETLNRIFEPFFTTKEKGEGTGMGLSVADGIITRHGGAITATSTVGQGSQFDVYLPLSTDQPARPEAVEGPLPSGSESILMVDDEVFIVDLVTQMLESLGYTVITCTSAIEALDLFRKDPQTFDLVITDMTMPQMTGDILSRNLLSIRPEIPIILCTGYSQYLDEFQAKKIGIKEFVMKPIVIKNLATAIRNALDN